MNVSLALPLALALALGATNSANAADAELHVSGTITPAACVVTVPDAVLDFGDVPLTNLPKGRAHFRADRTAKLDIQCSSPSHVGLLFHDQYLPSNYAAKNFFYLLRETETDDPLVGIVQMRVIDGIADGSKVSFGHLKSSELPFLAVADDPDNPMVIDRNNKAYRSISATLSVSVLGDEMDQSELPDAMDMYSSIGIELKYM